MEESFAKLETAMELLVKFAHLVILTEKDQSKQRKLKNENLGNWKCNS